jgi:cytochrome-b5 reductase
VLGLPVGQHIVIYANVNGEPVKRKYTPVSSDNDKGYFDLVIKVYKSGVNERFPDGGKMTQHVDDMEIGDLLTISGPVGRMTYHGKGNVTMIDKKSKKKSNGSYKRMGMIAGGSGIAPMLQLIEAVIRDEEDNTELFLLFANQTEKDILMRDRLEQLVKENPHRLRVWYTVDRVTEGQEWEYSTGFVNSDMIAQHLPPPDQETLILICGPPAMIKLACNPNLDKLGYREQHRFKY